MTDTQISPVSAAWPRLERTAPSDQRSFRDALGRYPTGVVLVSAMTDDGPVGMAVNSFTSVSLDPPLVSFCPMLTSTTWAKIRPVGGFAISTLRDCHTDVSRLFSRRDVDRFGIGEWRLSPAGHPVIADALGWIDATVEWMTDAGDHELVVARATAWSESGDGDPLVFYRGGYHRLAVEGGPDAPLP
ncbi:flavin reductase family protein [Microbacterium album]|uniref:Monooxygenase n=1 Tax=Microbacterium album TaxID=2053191 RepID=A0A917IE92_9MICO|nr:flavin reductase family protein [Microbacterium album]GGH40979.1 monooxygenase [Microbacterium album]